MNSYLTLWPARMRRGITFIDLLTTLAILSSVMAVGIVATNWSRQTATDVKLRQDVATLNRAVRMYLTGGGAIKKEASGGDVINQLKLRSDEEDEKTVAGLTGSLIDPRLSGEVIAAAGPVRAVWDKDTKQFVLRNEGAGFQKFVLDEASIPGKKASDQRAGSYQFARTSGWIWDNESTMLAAAGPAAGNGTRWVTPAEPGDITDGIQGVLSPPVFSLSGGLRDPGDYNLSLLLTDVNPAGSSVIYYSQNGGSWHLYKPGASLSIAPELLNSVRAFSAPVDAERWNDSRVVEEKYETIWFSGSSTGSFHDPKGDGGMVTNLTPGAKLPEFTWGTPSAGYQLPNRLFFTGAAFSKIAPGEDFVLGTLEYNNGTTASGTNATEIQIALGLSLTSLSTAENLNFVWGLESVPNKASQTDDENADYVRMGNMASQLQTVVNGRRYLLNLRFGEHTADGFTTVGTFHTHEGKSMTGTIYGNFSLDPASGVILPRMN